MRYVVRARGSGRQGSCPGERQPPSPYLVRPAPTTRVPSDVMALIMFASRIRPRVPRAAVFGDGIGRMPSPMRLV
jgi:hypothetical protein